MMDGHMLNAGGMGWGWMMALMLVFWGTIIGLIVWTVYRVTGGQGRSISSTPLETVKMRYARGEITKPEFETLKKDLA